MAAIGGRVSFLLLLFFLLGFGFDCCYASFGFDVHHRFSDRVKAALPSHHLPAKGTPAYYAFMAHRDRLLHGRRLSSTTDLSKLTFEYGNETYYIDSLGYLHYVNVSVGTPRTSYLVALDTGSDLFWLPCDCTSCIRSLKTSDGNIELNIYSPNASTSSKDVPCSSTLCAQQQDCAPETDTCPFNINYVSANTSSNGILVEDVLHMVTDDNLTKPVSPRITFGCGQVLTGSFLNGAAPNGLFGLGIEDESVPSILASQGLISNSFSLCFGQRGLGRISFGDEGSSDQGETPIIINKPHPTYNISISNIKVGSKSSALPFTAIFDSGTSFTYLSDPAYTYITETFNSQANNSRHVKTTDFPFDYCYDLSATETSYVIPLVILTMKGGDTFAITDPTIILQTDAGAYVYCLGLLKSQSLNLIGQNFMTGYRFVFNRDKMILGWKKSNCKLMITNMGGYDQSNTKTVSPTPNSSPAVPPATAADPPTTTNSSPKAAAPPPAGNNSSQLNKLTYSLMIIIIFALIAIF